MLRAASVNFTVLCTFLSALYKARNGHMHVLQIDKALCSGKLCTLMVLSDLENFEALFSNSVDSIYEHESLSDHTDCTFKKPNLESLIAKCQKRNE